MTLVDDSRQSTTVDDSIELLDFVLKCSYAHST